MKTSSMKIRFLSLALASAFAAAVPAVSFAQAGTAAAAAQSPAGQFVLTNSNRILTTLQQRRAEFKASPAALKQYIGSELNNTFDRMTAARAVLGIHARGASDADVKLFADALVDSLTQRYGSALLGFEGHPSFKVKSVTTLPNNLGMEVSTDLVRQGADPTPVIYRVRNTGGQWRIFDVVIEGISYVQTFRNQFDAPLRQKSIAQVAADIRNGTLQVAQPAAGNGKPARGK